MCGQGFPPGQGSGSFGATSFLYNSSFSNGTAPAVGFAMRLTLLGISQCNRIQQAVYRNSNCSLSEEDPVKELTQKSELW